MRLLELVKKYLKNVENGMFSGGRGERNGVRSVSVSRAPSSWGRDTGSVLASPKPEEGNSSRAHSFSCPYTPRRLSPEEKRFKSFSKKQKIKYGEQTKWPPSLSLLLGPLAVTPELRLHRWGAELSPFSLFKYFKIQKNNN